MDGESTPWVRTELRQQEIAPFSERARTSISLLVLAPKGFQIKAEYIRNMINLRTKQAKINKLITPHSFRRSFATLLNSKKCNLTTIQKLLGHSHITTTASYIHNDYDTLFADYSKLWKTPNQSQI